jgi:hypothetical protein
MLSGKVWLYNFALGGGSWKVTGSDEAGLIFLKTRYWVVPLKPQIARTVSTGLMNSLINMKEIHLKYPSAVGVEDKAKWWSRALA